MESYAEMSPESSLFFVSKVSGAISEARSDIFILELVTCCQFFKPMECDLKIPTDGMYEDN